MVRLSDENSRGKVQNVCEGSSVIFLSAASVVVYGCLSILRAFATVIAWSAVLAIICYLCLANIPWKSLADAAFATEEPKRFGPPKDVNDLVAHNNTRVACGDFGLCRVGGSVGLAPD